ncbi:MAG: imidazole glycerol phosphate synthase subunit HisF [Sulfobacillus acidophilus]|uniref:Imidazole glycerol phosphate synthase subunit HisF n=1 Tax=Sulfobacillus acidophilus TaxID=53633 RepID=A0A2T2WE32_9FIRM|nr:MAG: imidazole glycerol phosphate synthase subunit HisF [Sulfobacillus acidophilus]
MLKARIIPCLDVRQGRTVKGVHFENMVDSGDPVDQALFYAHDGADEIVWLDITATLEDRALHLQQIAELRRQLKIPLTVGGGIRTIADVERVLNQGADKVSINSAAVYNPDLVEQVARRWGSQCVVVAVDAKRVNGQFEVFTHGGKRPAGRTLGPWLREAEERGAGEFLLTSIDSDGVQAGYDVVMMNFARGNTARPIIASGGAGSIDHLADMLAQGHTALLLASLLHQGQVTVHMLKRQLKDRGFAIRVDE